VSRPSQVFPQLLMNADDFWQPAQVFMLAAGAEPELHAKTKMEIFVASCPPESLVALGLHVMVEV